MICISSMKDMTVKQFDGIAPRQGLSHVLPTVGSLFLGHDL